MTFFTKRGTLLSRIGGVVKMVPTHCRNTIIGFIPSKCNLNRGVDRLYEAGGTVYLYCNEYALVTDSHGEDITGKAGVWPVESVLDREGHYACDSECTEGTPACRLAKNRFRESHHRIGGNATSRRY